MLIVNDKLRIIRLDDKNLELQELRLVRGKTKGTRKEWCWCGYYGDVKTALKGALNKQLFDSIENELTIKDLIAKIELAEKEILNAKEIPNE